MWGVAVGVRLGKVLSGVVWHGGVGSVSVRQSCLGTVRRVAVMFGEVRSGSHGTAGSGCSGRGEALRGQAGLGSQGTVSLVAVRLGLVRQSRRCKLWRGEFWRVWPGLGSLGLLSSGLERRCGASFCSQGALFQVTVLQVWARIVTAVTARNINQ